MSSTVKTHRPKAAEEITKSLTELRTELATTKRSHKMGELKNFRKLRNLRREIAVLLTLQKELMTKEDK